MKAVTVAGGSSDDPEIEGTTVAGADPDDTSAGAGAGAGAGAVPEGRAGRPEPASGEPEVDVEVEVDERTGTAPEAGSTTDAPSGTDTEDEAPAGPEAPGAGPDDAEEETSAGPESPTKATARSRTESEDEPDPTAAEDDAPEASDATSVSAEALTGADDAEEETSAAADEDEAPEASDATRVLKMPARATATPDDTKTAKAPAGPDDAAEKTPAQADETEGTDAEDEAPKRDDATRALKMPARATTTPDDTKTAKAPAGPDDAAEKTPAQADEDEAPEASDVTRVLKMPAPSPAKPKVSEPSASEAKDDPKGGTGRTEAGAEADDKPGARAAEKDDKGSAGGAGPRPAANRTDGAKASAGGPRVPGWAKADDTDSERTSQFVALKDLDVPPPVPARPQPQSAAQAATPPPLPPLDLLAELTNTPAPPETPRRTALRRVKVWTPILLLLAGACIGGQMLRPLPDPRLVAAETEHTVDGQFAIPWPGKGQGAVRVVGSGDIGTFGEQKPVPTASVAKIMTAYVILKGHPLRKGEPGPDITVDAKTVADGNSEHESRITGLTAGSKFSQQDMLKMLMIPSGNNVARLLARWDTGTDSEAAFVEKMNAAARELGMKDTTYTDPSGLDAGTVSTATDQLNLAEAVMKDETFRSIVALPEAPIKGLGEKLVNNNHLLTESNLSIRGIKTGSSTPAGGTFVWAAYKTVGDETRLIIGSLMEQRAPAPDQDALQSLALVKTNSKKIIESVRTGLASAPLVRKGDTVGYVDDGLGGRTPLVAVKDLNVISVPGQRFKLSLKAGDSALPHTAKAGTEVAVLTAGEGEGAKSVPVAVQGALAEPSFGTRLTRIG
ncbi:D-alanyl-D-alanine carboxypeptidase family protein [Streptomyces sp. NRRL S-98]|uniref:D-alanyl-D-alanine carboxypeptidase family protein n=1 Tax=Streptomyces sp. NRRL S-98 TaxID=1463922 RepID=UPI0020A6A477|nr:serine hydrolase [Streptomyces sp. NRRL S-98]